MNPEAIIAVIIPTYNRPGLLQKCLWSLSIQTLPKTLWEVIVVNDGGVDVSEMVQTFGDNFNSSSQKNQGPAAARNFGTTLTKVPIFAFLDDDCQASSTWLEEIVKNNKSGVLIGGNVVNFYRDNLFSESSQLLIAFLYQHFQDTPNQFFTSNNFSIHRTDFIQHGGFQNQFITSAGEDREFCVRLNHQGMELKFIPEVEIIHFHQLNLRSFIRLHRKYGKAALVFQKIMESQKIAIQKRPRLEFYRKLVVFPFYQNHLSKKEKIFVSLSLMLSQICVVQGYLLEKIKSQKPLKVG